MTYKEREELKALSKSVFGSTSFYQNKLMPKHKLYTFNEVKAKILKIQEDTQNMLNTMKDSAITNVINK